MSGLATADNWHPAFRHSAGRLGTRFLAAIRVDRELLGWRCGRTGQLLLPPRDRGANGEWVRLGPGARLVSALPAAWIGGAEPGVPDGFVLARVLPDGAAAPIFSLLRVSGRGNAKGGARLTMRFGGAADLWYEAEARET